MKYFILIFCLFAVSCNNNDNTIAGGPCTYRYDTLAAIVINITTQNNNLHDLVMVLDHPAKHMAYADTIHYFFETGQLLSDEVLAEKRIHVNDTLLYVKGNMITGSCNPKNNRLLLERYKPRT